MQPRRPLRFGPAGLESEQVQKPPHLTFSVSVADSLSDLDSCRDDLTRFVGFSEPVQNLAALEPCGHIVRMLAVDSRESLGSFLFFAVAGALHRERVIQEEIARIRLKHFFKRCSAGHLGNLSGLNRFTTDKCWLQSKRLADTENGYSKQQLADCDEWLKSDKQTPQRGSCSASILTAGLEASLAGTLAFRGANSA